GGAISRPWPVALRGSCVFLQSAHSPPEPPDPPHAHLRCSTPGATGLNDCAPAASGFAGICTRSLICPSPSRFLPFPSRVFNVTVPCQRHTHYDPTTFL